MILVTGKPSWVKVRPDHEPASHRNLRYFREHVVEPAGARYAQHGPEGLRDAPRTGRPLTHGPDARALLIAKACTPALVARLARAGHPGLEPGIAGFGDL